MTQNQLLISGKFQNAAANLTPCPSNYMNTMKEIFKKEEQI